MTSIYPDGLPIAMSLTGYGAFLTGLIVWLKRRDKAGRLYFVWSFAVSLWAVALSFNLNNYLPDQVSRFWARFAQSGAVLIPATWLHFVLTYAEQKRKTLLKVVYSLTFLFFILSFAPVFVIGFRSIVAIDNYTHAGLTYFLFTVFFFLVISYSFWVFYIAWKTASSEDRKKDYKFIFFASLYGFAMGSLSFFPVYGFLVPQYNLLAMPIWQILLVYVMTRHHVFDLSSLAYAARRDKMAAIGTLAASINHEIRNPLYIIQGLAESHMANVQDKIFSDGAGEIAKSREILKKTSEQAHRALQIMKKFAAFAKQEVNQKPVTEQVSINGVLENITPLVNHELDLDKIQLKNDLPADLDSLTGDVRHFEEILFNLIVNGCQAIKQSGKGSAISISAIQNNGTTKILVRDNGPGVSEDTLKHVFEPFYTTKRDGTGLGLYITKQLVEKNGGSIRVSSKVGEGTLFELSFKKQQ